MYICPGLFVRLSVSRIAGKVLDEFSGNFRKSQASERETGD